MGPSLTQGTDEPFRSSDQGKVRVPPFGRPRLKEVSLDLVSLVKVLTQTDETLRLRAAKAVNIALVVRNWMYGYYIVEFEQQGEDRAKYGTKLLETMSKELKLAGIFGSSVTNLKNCRYFYESTPHIRQTVSGELSSCEKELATTTGWQTVYSRLYNLLSNQFRLGWSHYLVLISITNIEERRFYEIEAEDNSWAVRELERQIASGLYERLALSRDQKMVRRLAEQGQVVVSPRDAVKDPYVLEFLGMEQQSSFTETELESAIIDKLENFLLELGKGFLFESRQKRFTFDEDHFYVDLVCYNRLLSCYVLIDLKLDKLSHQDLGQMQMYVNYYDRFVKTEQENPTIGIVLCKRKKDALVELTLPENANIFASKYQLYLPSKDELRLQLESCFQDQRPGRANTPTTALASPNSMKVLSRK